MEGSGHRVGDAYDELASTYDDFHVDNKSLAENAFVGEVLRRRIGPADRVVDIGCGTGLLLDLVDISADRYLGLDVSPEMLRRARIKHPGYRFELADAEKPRILESFGRFDVVVSLFGSPSYCELGAFADSVRSLLEDEGRYFLMYCGPGYVERSTYINRAAKLLKSFDRRALSDAFRPGRVWGMSWLVDHVPSWLSAPVMQKLLQIDVRTIGKIAPDRCFFVVVEG